MICRVRAAFGEPFRTMVEVRNHARVHLWFRGEIRRAVRAALLHCGGARALYIGDICGLCPT